ncbi:MAG: DUF1295 domain-containing protein [Desulfobacterales bacterium]|nr:DUF1295 domain-containing protein [Desulfobacterales bacterium]
MISILSILIINFTLIIFLMLGLWVVSLIIKDASIADVFWGIGFVVLAWLTFFIATGYPVRSLLLTLLVTAWGLRLALHIGWRNRGKHEDPRYGAWRRRYGKRFWWVSLFKVFLLQGVILWIISLTVQMGQIAQHPSKISLFDYLGTIIWGVGFFFEAISDWQLARFKSMPENKGHVMDQGLWALSRHPNYFGETLVWWGLFIIGLSSMKNIWTVISPLTITWLLLKVSGVPLLENNLKKRKSKYQTYIQRTSAFIPLPPKK